METGAVAVSSGGCGGGGGIRWNQRAARQSGFYLSLSLGRCRGALHGHPFEALHRVCDLLDLFRDLELHLHLLDLLLQRLDLRFLHAGNRRTQKNWELRVLRRCCHWASAEGWSLTAMVEFQRCRGARAAAFSNRACRSSGSRAA